MPKRWGSNDHEKAFLVWAETHNMSEVVRQVGCSYDTGRRWKKQDFSCTDGCAWHGWDRLEEEKNAAHQAQAQLVQDGNFDPVAHDQAIRKVLTGGASSESRAAVIKRTVRSDLERASHWEFIYAKAFYKATGQVIEWNTFQGGNLTQEVIDKMQGVMTVGLTPTSFEQCIKVMKIAEEQINLIRGRPREHFTEAEDEKPMSAADLREIRAKMLERNKRPLPKLASGGETQVQIG